MKHATNTMTRPDEIVLALPYIALMLQAFADGKTITTASDGTGGTSDVSPEIRAYYHRNFMENTRANLVHEQFGTKYMIPEKHGQTINMRRMEHLPDVDPNEPLLEGVTPDGDTLRITETTVGIDSFGRYIEISDLVMLTSPDPILTEATGEQGYQASRLRDKCVRNKMAATTNKMYAPKADGTPITKADSLDGTCLMTVRLIRSAVTKMKKNNIQPLPDGKYVCIIHPHVEEDLKNDEEFNKRGIFTESGAQKVYEGEIGYIEGVRFVVATDALITRNTGDTNSIYHNFLIGRGAYGVTGIEGKGIETIVKPFGSGNDPLNQRMTSGWKTIVGAKVLSAEALLDVCTSSTYSDEPAN